MTSRSSVVTRLPPRRRCAQRARSPQLLVGVLAVLALSGGCSRKSEVSLLQPFAPPAQRMLKFTGDNIFERRSEGVRTLLLEFPLPGAKDGPHDFLIFIAAPDRAGAVTVGPLSDGATASGFLIQTVGKRAGKAVFAGGTIRVQRDAAALGAERIDLDINCDDGTHITGRAYPRSTTHELLVFERHYRADIAAVLAPPPTPVADAGPTPSSAADAGATPTPAAAEGKPRLAADEQTVERSSN